MISTRSFPFRYSRIHLNEATQDQFLADLHRICQPGGLLFLTIHGHRALERAVREKAICDMIAVPDDSFTRARNQFACGEHAFILQHGHLTTTDGPAPECKATREPYEYGIAFIPTTLLRQIRNILKHHLGIPAKRY